MYEIWSIGHKPFEKSSNTQVKLLFKTRVPREHVLCTACHVFGLAYSYPV